MKRALLAILLVSLVVLPAAGGEEKTVSGDSVTAEEIIRRSDDLLRGGKSYAEITMTVVRPRWQRTVTMEGWTQGTENAFIRILAPSKDRGVTFLKKGREAWQYVPAIDKVIKLPPSMMLQSWMGSDFTNDDVVRADSLVTDYNHAIVDQPSTNGVEYWVVDATPKPDAAVVWGKVRFKVRKSNFVADRVEFYDEDGELVRYYEAENIRNIEGIEVATRLTAHDVTEPGNRTVITYSRLTFKPEISEETFTVRNLRN